MDHIKIIEGDKFPAHLQPLADVCLKHGAVLDIATSDVMIYIDNAKEEMVPEVIDALAITNTESVYWDAKIKQISIA